MKIIPRKVNRCQACPKNQGKSGNGPLELQVRQAKAVEPKPTKFSEWLKAKMAERGESQYKVAKSLCVSQSTVSNWLNGNNPTRCHKRLVAEHFGVTVEEVP